MNTLVGRFINTFNQLEKTEWFEKYNYTRPEGKSSRNLQHLPRPNGWLNKDFRTVNILLFKEYTTFTEQKCQASLLLFKECMSFARQKKQD